MYYVCSVYRKGLREFHAQCVGKVFVAHKHVNPQDYQAWFVRTVFVQQRDRTTHDSHHCY